MMTDWQTIDSAPRDETKIFITWPGASCAVLVRWQCFEGGCDDSDEGWVFMWALEDDGLLVGQEMDGWIGFEGDPEPTHWILPPPESPND